MKKVGLTGGLGSGKSTVATIFQILGIPVYNSDSRAKQLMISNTTIIKQLKFAFGEEVYGSNGELNKAYLAAQIFTNKSNLAKVNTIVHPVITEDFIQWANKQQAPYVIHESAIMFETNLYKTMDVVISVLADENIRIERAIKRDNSTREQIIDRLNNQTDDTTRLKLSDYTIQNNNNLIINDILKIHTQLWENSQNG